MQPIKALVFNNIIMHHCAICSTWLTDWYGAIITMPLYQSLTLPLAYARLFVFAINHMKGTLEFIVRMLRQSYS